MREKNRFNDGLERHDLALIFLSFYVLLFLINFLYTFDKANAANADNIPKRNCLIVSTGGGRADKV